jgi:hypothetical protein
VQHLVPTVLWLQDKVVVNELHESYVSMFNTLGAYQIRDKVTGEVYDIKPDFIDTFGFNPYKILMDDSLEKGSAVRAFSSTSRYWYKYS